MNNLLLAVAMMIPLQSASAQQTERLYLSDGKPWQFRCSSGMQSGRWSKIAVPSCWELQGFGDYTFGRYYLKGKDVRPSDEQGEYLTEFRVPSTWRDKHISIVFEGVMTDAEVKINGQSVGPIHQGAFTEFSYDATPYLKTGLKNRLEVKVSKQSANKSVNDAERRADWWLFGGIYRPVYLKAVPPKHIEQAEVDARADGKLRLRLHTRNLTGGEQLRLSIDRQEQTVALAPLIETHWEGVDAWNPEHPRLYTLRLQLLSADGTVLHETQERIGFRTIEFRKNDGIYLNGTKLVLKGVNRHCFWPDAGRTLTREQSLQDAQLIKQMNMNAVRSHYSPDHHFLEICDSIGLLYFDEFCGWHGRYDTATGRKLLREQIATDQNHPCVFMWGNGNEGGWNPQLDTCFATLDLQQRHVAHPWQDWNDIDTHHYPAYYTGTGRLHQGYKVFMPTEFLHAQYDRGAGAGLEDYWQHWTESPHFAGAFIWSFSDEAVVRRDAKDSLDTDGPNGPDGIVGPYREKEASFYAIRDIWSPIQIKPLLITPHFDGTLLVSNQYLFSRIGHCRLVWDVREANQNPSAHGQLLMPDIAPGETARLQLRLPEDFFRYDILTLTAYGLSDEPLCTWRFPIGNAQEYHYRHHHPASPPSSPAPQIEGHTLKAGPTEVTFADDGQIARITHQGRPVPFTGGFPVGLKATIRHLHTRIDGHDALLIAHYDGGIDSLVWRLRPDGTLGLEAVLVNRRGDYYDNPVNALGLSFRYPESLAKGVEWLGSGPYRVWKNRLRGQSFGLWQKAYNNTITGESSSEHPLVYPEFKGYHANIYWAQLQSDESPITIMSETDGLYLRLFTPEEPVHRRDGKNTMPPFPDGDISLLFDIPAIQSFRSISEQGPRSQPSTIRLNVGDAGLHLRVWFRFS